MTVLGQHLNGGTVHVDGVSVPTTSCHAPGPGGQGPAALCFVTPPHPPGPASITVWLPDGHHSNAMPFAFTVTPPPHIGQPIPDRGSDNGGTAVMVTGESLDQGTVFVDGTAVATQECHQRGSPSIALCFVTPPHTAGPAGITVHTPDGAESDKVRFTYTPTPPPNIARLTPASGPDLGGTRVQVTGQNLDQGFVLVDGNRATMEDCGRGSAGRRPPPSALCFLTPGHRAGRAFVTVETPNGKVSNRVPYTYTDTPAPHIDRLNPTHGPDVGGNRVQIEGKHLDKGVVLVDGSPVATDTCPIARTARLGLCFTTPPHKPGHASITVATPNFKTSNAVPYIYVDTPAPVITSLRPSTASVAGGTPVTVVGDRVSQGVVYVDGHAVASGPCSNLTATFPGPHETVCFVAPAHARGIATVVVDNPNGKVSNAAHLDYR